MNTDHRYPDRQGALPREENAREYPARQDTLKEENERLQRELLRQEQTLRKLCFETQDHRDRLDAVEAELASFRKSGLYKLTLLLRRFKIQLLGGKGPDRKDFLRWVW